MMDPTLALALMMLRLLDWLRHGLGWYYRRVWNYSLTLLRLQLLYRRLEYYWL